MSALIAWFKSKNKLTHTIGMTLLTVVLVYDGSPELRGLVSHMFTGHSDAVTKLGVLCANIAAVVTIWAKYSHSSSAVGVIAKAQEIEAEVSSTKPELVKT